MLWLNVGSGQRRFDQPWINVDIQLKHPPDVIADANALPFKDNSAELIVFHHVLEHFGCGEANGILKEAWRVLAKNGSLLIFVPNMKALASHWLRSEINDFTFMVNTYGAYQGDEADRHKWGYSMIGLLHYVDEVLKARAKLFDNRTFPGANIAVDWWIVGVEAVKEPK